MNTGSYHGAVYYSVWRFEAVRWTLDEWSPGVVLPDSFMTSTTLDALVTGPFNADALACARTVAFTLGVKINPLLLVGESGVGKTHLLRAIRTEVNIGQSHLRASLLSAEALVSELVAAIWAHATDTVFMGLRETTDLLLLDHVEILVDRRGTASGLLAEIGSMVESDMQVVLVCTPHAAASIGLSDWVATFPLGRTVTVDGPDADVLTRFVRAEASRMGLGLPPDDLRGSLASLNNFSEAQGQLNRVLLRAGVDATGLRPRPVAGARSH